MAPGAIGAPNPVGGDSGRWATIAGVSKRSYGSGRLYARAYPNGGGEAWYGEGWVGVTRVKRKLGPKRTPGTSDGLTRTQAERELRRRMETERVVAGPQRPSR